MYVVVLHRFFSELYLMACLLHSLLVTSKESKEKVFFSINPIFMAENIMSFATHLFDDLKIVFEDSRLNYLIFERNLIFL